MTEPLVIVPIVEGHGEVAAFPILLRRLGALSAPERPLDIRRPIRVSRAHILKPDQLGRYVELAALQHGGAGATIVLFDADDDCPASLGPKLQKVADAVRPGSAVSVVLAMREFEAWFLAAAKSLRGVRGLPDDLAPPPNPEAVRDAKGWLQYRRTDGLAYSPTVDQPALAAQFDLDEARAASSSFDKLAREVERILESTAQ